MKVDDKNLEWEEKSRKKLLSTPVLNVLQTESVSPQGLNGNYIVLDARDWVIVIPVLEKDFIMVKQWRHGAKTTSIEFPGGVIEKNESPEDAAHRELLEETGFNAKKLVSLATMSPNPALFSNKVHFFVALSLEDTGKQKLDKDEYVQYLRLPQQEVLDKMGTAEYPHALMAAALDRYRSYYTNLIG